MYYGVANGRLDVGVSMPAEAKDVCMCATFIHKHVRRSLSYIVVSFRFECSDDFRLEEFTPQPYKPSDTLKAGRLGGQANP